jgi:hypothetical protein
VGHRVTVVIADIDREGGEETCTLVQGKSASLQELSALGAARWRRVPA